MNFPTQPPRNALPARNWHLQYLADHLSAVERDVWGAFLGDGARDCEALARTWMGYDGAKVAVVDATGMPVAIGGFLPVRGQVYAGWTALTEAAWTQHAKSVTHAMRWLMGQLYAQGARRLEATTVAKHTHVLNWYTYALGLSADGILPAAGVQGEDLAVYSRIAGESHVRAQ